MNVTSITPYRMSLRQRVILLVLLAVGALSLHLTFKEDPTRGWMSYLLGSVLFLGMGLCGLFFVAIQHIVSASWSTSLRRIAEAMALTLPVAALLGFGIYYGAHSIYEWTHTDVVNADPLLKFKEPYLNMQAFGFRLIAYFAIWIVTTFILVRNSMKQDHDGDVQRTIANRRWSALTLVLFALSVSLAGFDLLMSLEPHWFSTMFGVHFFAGFFQAGLAMTIILTWMAVKSGALKGFVNVEHFYDLGKFLFAFSIFWGYIAFSEFMLIWYAHLPEETFFYAVRMTHGWEWFGLAMLLIRLAFPFFVLIPYGSKRNFKILIPACFVILLGQWVELFWIIKPTMRHMSESHASHASLAWTDLGVALGFFALFFLVVGLIMERIRIVPLKDPRLEASIHHHG